MNYSLPSSSNSSRQGFSLLEVLIATLILGIGLIMVASIFPVGAKWSQQGAEETIAQNLALNAVSIIKTKYAPNPTLNLSSGFNRLGTPSSNATSDAFYLNGSWNLGTGALAQSSLTQRVFTLPDFAWNNGGANILSPLAPNLTPRVPITERVYGVGMGQPFPVQLSKCFQAQYFWTALMRVPDDNTSKTITLYILVFRRGDAAQTFSTVPPTYAPYNALTELGDCRNTSQPLFAKLESISGNAGNKDFFTPSVWIGKYVSGTLVNGQITGAFPPVGSFGIGAVSGTVFRQVLNPTGSTAEPSTPSSLLIGQTSTDVAPTENVISAIPPDGWPDSPLIYIYQTQLSF